MSNSYELLIRICDIEDSTHDIQSAQMLLEMAKDVKD